jgi:hypothetical protein
VTECEPAVRLEVAKVAFPLLSVPVPRVVLPSLNVTVPVAPDVTVAVNFTDEPYVDGLAEDAKVVEDALLTVCDSAEEVLLL